MSWETILLIFKTVLRSKFFATFYARVLSGHSSSYTYILLHLKHGYIETLDDDWPESGCGAVQFLDWEVAYVVDAILFRIASGIENAEIFPVITETVLRKFSP